MVARDFVDGIVEYDPALLDGPDLDPTSYTGNARLSQAFFDSAAARHRSVVAAIQETISTRSQEGYDAGRMDVEFAASRMRARAGWKGGLEVVVSDGDAHDAWDASEYGRGVSDGVDQARDVFTRFWPYGAKGVTATFLAGAAHGAAAALLQPGDDGHPGDVVPGTWGYGTVAEQVVGPSPIPETDLNRAHVDLRADTPSGTVKETTMWYALILNPGEFVRAYEVGGSVILRELDYTAPRGAYGIPTEALDSGLPYRRVDTEKAWGVLGTVWDQLQATTRAALVVPAADPAQPVTATVDPTTLTAAQLVALHGAVTAEVDRRLTA